MDQVLKEDVQNAPGNYLFLILANFLSAGFSFFIAFVLTRSMGKENYGKYGILLFVVQSLLLLSSTWILNSILRFGREEFEHDKTVQKTLGGYTAVSAAIYLITSATVFFFRNQIGTYIGITSRHVLYMLIFTFFSLANVSLMNVYQATRRMATFGIMQLADKILFLLTIFIILAGFKYFDMHLLVCALILSSGLLLAINLTVLFKNGLYRLSFDAGFLKNMLGFSLPLLLSCIMSHFGIWFGTLVINQLMGKSSAGSYYLANQINVLFGAIIVQSSVVVAPILVLLYSKKKTHLIQDYINELVPSGIFLWASFIAICMLVFGLIFTRIFGASFNQALWPLLILLLSTGFAAIPTLLLVVLSTYKFTWVISRSLCVFTALIIAGNLLIADKAGIYGAAITQAFAYIVFSLIVLFETKRKFQVNTLRFILPVFPVIGAFAILAFTRSLPVHLFFAVCLAFGCVSIFKRTVISPALVKILKNIDSPVLRFLKKGSFLFR